MVLDDYHAIGASEVHEAVTFLLDHLPDHLHLVMATRPIRRCLWPGCAVAGSSASCAPPNSASPHLRRGVPQPRDGAGAHRRRRGRAGGPYGRLDRRPRLLRSLCAASPTAMRSLASFRRSPAATGLSSTTWPTRFLPGNPRSFVTSCSAPPSSTDSTARCATPSQAAPTVRGRWRTSSGETLRCPARHRALLVPLPPPVRRRAPRTPAREHPEQVPDLHERASAWFAARGLVADAGGTRSLPRISIVPVT